MEHLTEAVPIPKAKNGNRWVEYMVLCEECGPVMKPPRGWYYTERGASLRARQHASSGGSLVIPSHSVLGSDPVSEGPSILTRVPRPGERTEGPENSGIPRTGY